MRVFITGGTGTIGEAVIKELRRARHAVTGLSRSEASDAKLRALGATPHRGLLDQPASYQSAAAAPVLPSMEISLPSGNATLKLSLSLLNVKVHSCTCVGPCPRISLFITNV